MGVLALCAPLQVWRPGAGGEAEEDVELECDPSTYDCLHNFSLEWPCLRCARRVMGHDAHALPPQPPLLLFVVASTPARLSWRRWSLGFVGEEGRWG